MIVALLHEKNERYYWKVESLVKGMASRAGELYTIICEGYPSLNQWRDAVSQIHADTPVKGIVIFDEKVPVAIIKRAATYPDIGVSDNIMGNLTNRFVDSNHDGYFHMDEIPDDYTQDAWVCRLLPHSIVYTGVGWWDYWYHRLWALPGRSMNLGPGRSYGNMLDYWSVKLERITENPLKTLVAVGDWSGVDEENKRGFSLNMEGIRKDGIFENTFGMFFVEYSDPTKDEGIQKMWYAPSFGTAWHSAHSANSGLGDFRHDVAYRSMKAGRGPTLLLTYACSVGEWQSHPNWNILANIYNSRENNNIKCICGSGLLQYGGGFQTGFDLEGTWESDGSRNLFSFMKEYNGKPFGSAHKEWINRAMKHYKARQVNYPDYDWNQMKIQMLAMNILGDATVLL